MALPAGATRLWPQKRGAQAVLASVVITAMFGIGVWIIPTPPPYVAITLDTELLRYSVAREALAGILMHQATHSTGELDCPDGPAPDQGLSGLLQPAAGTTVEYRWSPDGVSVTVEGSRDKLASFTFADERTCEFTGDVASLKQSGAGLTNLRLPIAGRAEAGSETSVATPTSAPRGAIHAGEVTVFGRTLIGNELYPVAGATYPIPAGSRLASGRDFRDPDPIAGGAAWYGNARAGEGGLVVSATTDTTRLLLYRPGLDDQTETFSFGLLARIFNDPSLGLLTLSLGAFFLVVGVITAWMSLENKT